jgi:hypothetical protein
MFGGNGSKAPSTDRIQGFVRVESVNKECAGTEGIGFCRHRFTPLFAQSLSLLSIRLGITSVTEQSYVFFSLRL